MEVRLATEEDRELWDDFVLNHEGCSFMQSWDWGTVQHEFGVPVSRLLVMDQDSVAGVSLVLERSVLLGRTWLYVPRGPLLLDDTVRGVWNDKMVALGREKRTLFVRIDPLWQDESFFTAEWHKSEGEVQPRHTVVMDLTQSDDAMLANMHSKTRYNIRLAQRKGVTVRFSQERHDLKHFFRLMNDVKRRGEFRFHPESYYDAMDAVLMRRRTPPLSGGSLTMEYGVVEHDGDVLAVHLLFNFGGRVTYAHGASSSKKRELMGSHLLQWESIKRAKERGAQEYDFFGVAPADAKRGHAWSGITRFKEGFGGRREAYVGAYDMRLDPGLYALFSLVRRARRMTQKV